MIPRPLAVLAAMAFLWSGIPIPTAGAFVPAVPGGSLPSVMELPSTSILRERLDALIRLRDERAATTGPNEASPLTPAVRKAILSLSELRELTEGPVVRQRPTGSMRLLSAEDAAGGSKRLRVRSGVERRTDASSPAARVEVVVEVVVNADGLPVRTLAIGEDDPEFLALFD